MWLYCLLACGILGGSWGGLNHCKHHSSHFQNGHNYSYSSMWFGWCLNREQVMNLKGMSTIQSQHSIQPSAHTNFRLSFAPTAAEQVPLFISGVIQTSIAMCFLKHLENALIFIIPLSFRMKCPYPVPSLIRQAVHFLLNHQFQVCSLVPCRLVSPQPCSKGECLGKWGTRFRGWLFWDP